MNINGESIGLRIKRARKKAGISQEEAATRLEVSRPTISAIESGKRQALATDLIVFADLYDVDVRTFLYDDVIDEQRIRRILAYSEKFSSLSESQQNEVENYLDYISSRK